MKSLLASVLLILVGTLVTVNGFSVIVRSRTPAQPAITTTALCNGGALEVDATIEVVGGHGRIGSLFLKEDGAIAVPRGVAPGCLTRSTSTTNNDGGAPIIVAIPTGDCKAVFDSTPPSRQSDLVWVGNGLPSPSWQRDATVVVPHFGVLRAGGEPITSPGSPPTYVFGRHAAAVAAVLANRGVRVSIVESWTEVCYLAARKLLWASCMWLLCHDHNNDDSTDTGILPLTFKEVHEMKQEDLNRLVKELLPSFKVITAQFGTDTGNTALDSEEDILGYMKAYSLSMPEASSSKAIAMTELHDRNGIWFAADQSFHTELLQRVAGPDALARLHQRAANKSASRPTTTTPQNTTKTTLVPIPALDLVCHGETNAMIADPKIQSAIVVGGGIIGSSIARALVQRGAAGASIGSEGGADSEGLVQLTRLDVIHEEQQDEIVVSSIHGVRSLPPPAFSFIRYCHLDHLPPMARLSSVSPSLPPGSRWRCS